MASSRGVSSGEPLPWLEPVEDEDEPPALSGRKMLAAILVVLLAAGLVAGTLYWIGRSGATEGNGPPELIRAPHGPYKVKPDNPGGIDVTGDSETAFATGAGEDVDGQLDLDAVPEQPIAKPAPKAAEPAPAKEEKKEEPAEEPAAATTSAAVVQLGFYDNPSQANSAWTSLTSRFPALAGASKIVVPFQKGQRLRAGFGSADEARKACQLLKAAGDACFQVR